VAVVVPRYAIPGAPVELRITLLDAYSSRLPDELDVATASLASHLRVEAYLSTETARSPIAATGRISARGAAIATLPVPNDTPAGAKITIASLTIAGQPLPAGAAVLPASVVVALGMHTPLVLRGAASDCSAAPVISKVGTLFAPDSNRPHSVLVFSADGSPLATLETEALGLRLPVRSAALACISAEQEETLLLSDSHTLVALDPESRDIRWTAQADPDDDIDMGIAVLQRSGVAVVTSYSNLSLHVHRLSDGVRVASTSKGIDSNASHITVDPVTETVFVSSGGIQKFRWTGSALVHDGRVCPEICASFTPLTVITPSSGSGGSLAYLIAADYGSSKLHVYSLPDCKLVNTHTLNGTRVMSLTADPSGFALAVGNAATQSIHVLPWPLPPLDAAAT
jgi:hypothetical protein